MTVVSWRPAPWAVSGLLHGGFVGLLVLLSRILPAPTAPPESSDLERARIYLPWRRLETGGGGARSPLPEAQGQIPKVRRAAIIPPMQVITPEPKLLLDAGIELANPAAVPDAKLPVWGAPLAAAGPPSNGPGCCSGIGGKSGGGIGEGGGSSVGDGVGPGADRAGGGVSAPVPVFRIEPEYSADARKAKLQGMVLVELVVDEKGLPRDIHVVQGVGLGLDEKAVDAVMRWRFRPGLRNGKPVPVRVQIETHFRLL